MRDCGTKHIARSLTYVRYALKSKHAPNAGLPVHDTEVIGRASSGREAPKFAKSPAPDRREMGPVKYGTGRIFAPLSSGERQHVGRIFGLTIRCDAQALLGDHDNATQHDRAMQIVCQCGLNVPQCFARGHWHVLRLLSDCE